MTAQFKRFQVSLFKLYRVLTLESKKGLLIDLPMLSSNAKILFRLEIQSPCYSATAMHNVHVSNLFSWQLD